MLSLGILESLFVLPADVISELDLALGSHDVERAWNTATCMVFHTINRFYEERYNVQLQRVNSKQRRLRTAYRVYAESKPVCPSIVVL